MIKNVRHLEDGLPWAFEKAGERAGRIYTKTCAFRQPEKRRPPRTPRTNDYQRAGRFQRRQQDPPPAVSGRTVFFHRGVRLKPIGAREGLATRSFEQNGLWERTCERRSPEGRSGKVARKRAPTALPDAFTATRFSSPLRYCRHRPPNLRIPHSPLRPPPSGLRRPPSVFRPLSSVLCPPPRPCVRPSVLPKYPQLSYRHLR